MMFLAATAASLLTNDTAFGHRLTEPSFEVPRTYKVWVRGLLTAEDQRQIGSGLAIGRGEVTLPARLKILKPDSKLSHAEITLTEGKNREVRRLFEALGKPVVRLLRTRFGPFVLGTLKSGDWKEIKLQ